MAKTKRAISLRTTALIAIAFILIIGFGVFLNATFNTTSHSIIAVNPIYGNQPTATEYVIITQYGSENITISGTCTIYPGAIVIYHTTSTYYVEPSTNTTMIGTWTTTTMLNSSYTVFTHTTTLTATSTSYTCPQPVN